MPVRCLVVGTGKMGAAHLQALSKLELDDIAAWAPSDLRSEAAISVGAQFFHGQLDKALNIFQPTHAIVASPVDTLTSISIQLIEAGVRSLLVEKPVALNLAEGAALATVVRTSGVQLYVGYNRRFYSSIRTALRMIADAGEEIESVTFEFNEMVGDVSGPVGSSTSVQKRWLLANSLHVIDAALFKVGYPDPDRTSFVRKGTLVWHPAGSTFVGSGMTSLGKLFAYHANWSTPGRWGFEWMTSSARFIFRPLEKLSLMRPGSFRIEEVPIDDELDCRFKPGVYLQNQAFLRSEDSNNSCLVPLEDALTLLKIGSLIAGY